MFPTEIINPNTSPHLEDSARIIISCNKRSKPIFRTPAPKTKPEPSAAGPVWRGGARKRSEQFPQGSCECSGLCDDVRQRAAARAVSRDFPAPGPFRRATPSVLPRKTGVWGWATMDTEAKPNVHLEPTPSVLLVPFPTWEKEPAVRGTAPRCWGTENYRSFAPQSRSRAWRMDLTSSSASSEVRERSSARRARLKATDFRPSSTPLPR